MASATMTKKKEEQISRREAFTKAFDNLKAKKEFLFDELVQETEDIYCKSNKITKQELNKASGACRDGLAFAGLMGLKVKIENIKRVRIED